MPGGSFIAVVAIAGSIWGFVEGVAWLERQFDRMVDDFHGRSDEDAKAEALVPGFAAERNAPSYGGACRCRACQTHGRREPCSDFDED